MRAPINSCSRVHLWIAWSIGCESEREDLLRKTSLVPGHLQHHHLVSHSTSNEAETLVGASNLCSDRLSRSFCLVRQV